MKQFKSLFCALLASSQLLSMHQDPQPQKRNYADLLPKGVYRHHNGNNYNLLCVAGNTETEEVMAVYSAIDTPSELRICPAEIFLKEVEVPITHCISEHYASLLPKGVYKHYKNKLYNLLYIAIRSDREEAMVVYRAMYHPYSLWARPAKMFLEEVEVDGRRIRRFEFVGDAH